MRIGRNFTNMLEASFLTEKERGDLKSGRLSVGDMDARVQIKAKRDIVNQVQVGKKIGLDHIELDGGVPNPYLEMNGEEIEKAKSCALEHNITFSLHLPYTYVGASTCAFQESDRVMAVDLQKLYIDFAASLGCESVVMHPGSVPFYQAAGEYVKMVNESLLKTLRELASYALERKIVFHLENNTAFDSIGVYNSELVEKLSALKEEGGDVKYCFDIGHWFTIELPMHKSKFSLESVPDKPEDIIDEIPASLLHQVHLNDFFIKGSEFKFHPPLHYQTAFLKKGNLENLAKKFKEKEVKTVVVETAVRDTGELLNAKKILQEETEYLNGIFKS